MLYKPPVSVYLYGWAPGCDQQTKSWTAWHPLRCPCFPPIHSSITSKAPSAGGFYTNTCSLIYNSQWACRHPRLGITHVDNSSGSCTLGSKGQRLNSEVLSPAHQTGVGNTVPAISTVAGEQNSHYVRWVFLCTSYLCHALPTLEGWQEIASCCGAVIHNFIHKGIWCHLYHKACLFEHGIYRPICDPASMCHLVERVGGYIYF